MAPLHNRVRRTLLATLVFLTILAFLQWGIPALGVPPYILPRPTAVAAEFFSLDYDLPHHVAVTAVEGVGGFLIGSTVGILLAILFLYLPPLEDALYPWAVISQTIPLVALAPLLVLWFGDGILPRLAMSALFTFFPVLVNATQGFRHADRDMLDLLHSYAISPWQLFWTLRLPSALPALFSGLKIGAPLAIIGAIVGEFAGAGQGVGFIITVSTYHLETDRTFAAIVAASLLGIVLYSLLTKIERWIIFWQPGSEHS